MDQVPAYCPTTPGQASVDWNRQEVINIEDLFKEGLSAVTNKRLSTKKICSRKV